MYLRAPSHIRLAYILIILSAILPIGWGSWDLAMATVRNEGIYLGLTFFGPIVLFVIGTYRVFLVAKIPGTLDASETEGLRDTVRALGMVLLVVGAAFYALDLISWALMLALPGKFDVLGFYFYFPRFIALGLLGLIMFEFSRLLGFEQNARKQTA